MYVAMRNTRHLLMHTVRCAHLTCALALLFSILRKVRDHVCLMSVKFNSDPQTKYNDIHNS